MRAKLSKKLVTPKYLSATSDWDQMHHTLLHHTEGGMWSRGRGSAMIPFAQGPDKSDPWQGPTETSSCFCNNVRVGWFDIFACHENVPAYCTYLEICTLCFCPEKPVYLGESRLISTYLQSSLSRSVYPILKSQFILKNHSCGLTHVWIFKPSLVRLVVTIVLRLVSG